jgi:hypothetical protein
MRAHRVVWLSFCGVVGVTGAMAALTWELPTLILLFVLAALTGAAATMVALTPADDTRVKRQQWPLVLTNTAVSGAGTVAFVGLGSLLGAPMAVLVLALAVGGSPYVARRWIGWLREHEQLPQPRDPDEHLSSTAPAGTVCEIELTVSAETEAAELSDDALCLAWRASFSALERADSPAERSRIIQTRRAFLDELERRNPPGVAAWLASGARAAGDPIRFVLGAGGTGDTTIDWDALIQGTDK